MSHKLGKYIFDTSHQMKVKLNSFFSNDDLNGVQAHILGFVEYNDKIGQNVYQKDIEAEFKIRRSSVSSVLDTMEKNGYIMRQSVLSDARLKKIVLTEKATQLGVKYRNNINLFEETVEKNLTEEEIITLKNILDKISANIADMKIEEDK